MSFQKPNSNTSKALSRPKAPSQKIINASSVPEETPSEAPKKMMPIKKPKTPPAELKILSSYTATSGEVFQPEERIKVSGPDGLGAIAEIVSFYEDVSGNAWAEFKPVEVNPDYSWEKGCIRASLLVKA